MQTNPEIAARGPTRIQSPGALPDLPHDQGRRQSLGSEPPQYHRKERSFPIPEKGCSPHNSARAASVIWSSCGRASGSLQNYGYSSAMKGADFVWDKEKLNRFIATPDEVVPGNNMKPYGGLTSAEDRAKVIVFLESLATN